MNMPQIASIHDEIRLINPLGVNGIGSYTCRITRELKNNL